MIMAESTNFHVLLVQVIESRSKSHAGTESDKDAVRVSELVRYSTSMCIISCNGEGGLVREGNLYVISNATN